MLRNTKCPRSDVHGVPHGHSRASTHVSCSSSGDAFDLRSKSRLDRAERLSSNSLCRGSHLPAMLFWRPSRTDVDPYHHRRVPPARLYPPSGSVKMYTGRRPRIIFRSTDDGRVRKCVAERSISTGTRRKGKTFRRIVRKTAQSREDFETRLLVALDCRRDRETRPKSKSR